MIIFYNNKTGEFLGTIDGRVHDERQLNSTVTIPNIPAEDVSKYIVKYKQVYGEKEQPVFKNFLNQETMEVVAKKVGTKKVKFPAGLEIDDALGELFSAVEAGKLNLYKHKFTIEDGKITGFEELA